MPNDWDGLPDPKPCPFCGGVHLVVSPPKAEEAACFVVHCHECRAFGPMAPSAEGAVVRWNERPA